MNASTTQLSLDYLRGLGYTVDIVERWVPGIKGGNRIRKDLFGILDLVGIRDGLTIGVQTTAKSALSTRARKIGESPNLPLLRQAGWRIVVHGWHQPNGPRTRYVMEELVVCEGQALSVPAQRPRKRFVRVV
jgi:hypothetical protein